MTSIYGYYDDATQTDPTYDPGLGADCPVCHLSLTPPIVTISLMVPGDSRSYFYRLHRYCQNTLTREQETDIDSVIVDAVVRSRENN